MVLAPEHPLVEKITTEENQAAVREYRRQAERQTEIERLAADKKRRLGSSPAPTLLTQGTQKGSRFGSPTV